MWNNTYAYTETSEAFICAAYRSLGGEGMKKVGSNGNVVPPNLGICFLSLFYVSHGIFNIIVEITLKTVINRSVTLKTVINRNKRT